jgi:PAS domain S-box-containing protein
VTLLEERSSVLIVDHEGDNLPALENALAPLDVTVVKAGSGPAALKATLDHEFALAILDAHMPGMDGFELAGHLRGLETTRGIPIIFLTAGHPDWERVSLDGRSGAVDFVTKPFSPKVLVAKARVFLELHAAKRKISRQDAQLEKLIEEQRRASAMLEREISQCKMKEEELRDSEGRVRLLVESAPDAIFIQCAGRFAFLNQATVRLFGAQSAQELVGMDLLDRVHPESRGTVRERIRAINEERRQLPMYEERYLRMDGSVVDVEVASVPIEFEGQHCSLGFVRDVTERKRAERVMIHNQRMATVWSLAAGVAHEVNNPLGGILQSLQNIKRRLSPDLAANAREAEQQGCSLEAIQGYLRSRRILEFLDAIEESGHRAARIVANMLEFGRVETSERRLVDLNDLVEKSMSLTATHCASEDHCSYRDVLIEGDLDPGRPQALCIPSQMEQVLVNLLQNALHALEDRQDKDPPARITVRTAVEPGAVRIEVEDNGPGMEPGVLDRAFDPFFTTRSAGQGTGLGLSVSFFIVTNNHGGTLDVESSPGAGTRFVVRLPSS